MFEAAKLLYAMVVVVDDIVEHWKKDCQEFKKRKYNYKNTSTDLVVVRFDL